MNDPSSSIQRGMNRLFDEFANWGLAPSGTNTFAPSVDVSETDEEVRVRAELPGVDPNGVDVTVTGNTLTIRGEKRSEEEQKGESYHRVERRYGQFVRSIELPAAIDATKVEASYRNGILSVTLPKHEQARPKSVSIKVQE